MNGSYSDTLARMYNDGMSIRKISAQVGIPRERVRRLLHKANVAVRWQRVVSAREPIKLCKCKAGQAVMIRSGNRKQGTSLRIMVFRRAGKLDQSVPRNNYLSAPTKL